MNVIQNYLTTFMKGDFSVMEIRIFMKIVEQANHLITGMKVSRLIGKAVCTDGFNCNFIVPCVEILGEHNDHPERLKEALRSLHDKDIDFYDGDTKTWHLASIVDDVRLKDGDANLYFTVPIWLVKYILNFVNGNFTMYDLQLAMTLPSAYAVRLYWLVCSMSRPMDISIPLLRQMMGVPPGRYPKTKDFVKRCILTPQRLLDDRNMNSFKYTLIKGPTSKFGQYTIIRFTPIKRQERKVTSLTASAGLGSWCNTLLRQYLQTQCQFDNTELKANKSTLFEFEKLPGWQDKLVEIVNRQRSARKGKGYVIAAMKSEVEEHKRVVV